MQEDIFEPVTRRYLERAISPNAMETDRTDELQVEIGRLVHAHVSTLADVEEHVKKYVELVESYRRLENTPLLSSELKRDLAIIIQEIVRTDVSMAFFGEFYLVGQSEKHSKGKREMENLQKNLQKKARLTEKIDEYNERERERRLSVRLHSNIDPFVMKLRVQAGDFVTPLSAHDVSVIKMLRDAEGEKVRGKITLSAEDFSKIKERVRTLDLLKTPLMKPKGDGALRWNIEDFLADVERTVRGEFLNITQRQLHSIGKRYLRNYHYELTALEVLRMETTALQKFGEKLSGLIMCFRKKEEKTSTIIYNRVWFLGFMRRFIGLILTASARAQKYEMVDVVVLGLVSLYKDLYRLGEHEGWKIKDIDYQALKDCRE